MSDKFTGHWLVSEYVFNPDGTFAGVIQQKRQLDKLANGRTQVTQICTPEARLSDHAMGQFVGEWVFELSISGKERLYHGIDVVGKGIAWADGKLTGQGVWTRFGHNFTSYGVLTSPDRQLTGGQFYHGHQLIAFIVGVATPERVDHPVFPTLAHDQSPFAKAQTWQGIRTICTETDTQSKPTRWQFSADGWIEDGINTHITDCGDHWQVSGQHMQGGIAKQYGCAFDAVIVRDFNTENMTILLDSQAETMLIIRQQNKQIEFMQLQPERNHHE